MTPAIRTALLSIGTAGGAALSTTMFLATKGVDLYAIIDQLNVVVADIAKLIALVTPIATGAYAIWRSATSKNRLQDVEHDKTVKEIIVTDPKLADSLGPKVQTSASRAMFVG